MVSAPALVAGGIAAGAPAAVLAPAAGKLSSPLAASAAAPAFCLAAVAGESQVNLTWFPPAPAKEIAIYDATPGGQPVEAGPAVNESAQVPKLTNGTAYSFWLAADGGKTVVSNTVLATPTARTAFLTAAPADRYCLAAVAGDKQVSLTSRASPQRPRMPLRCPGGRAQEASGRTT